MDGTPDEEQHSLFVVALLWRALSTKIVRLKGRVGTRAPCVGAQAEPDQKLIVASVPAGKIEELRATCTGRLARLGMAREDLRTLAVGVELGGVIPQVGGGGGGAAAPRRPGKGNLAHRRQVESPLQRLHLFAEARAAGLTREAFAADKGATSSARGRSLRPPTSRSGSLRRTWRRSAWRRLAHGGETPPWSDEANAHWATRATLEPRQRPHCSRSA